MKSGRLELKLSKAQAWLRVTFRAGVRRNPKPRAQLWEVPRAVDGVGLQKEGAEF